MVRGLQNTFLAVYVPSAVVYLIASFGMYINPTEWWHVGFLALLYPFLLVVMVALTGLSFFIRKRYVWFGVVVLLLSFDTLSNTISFRTTKPFIESRQTEHIRIMSWNIRRFTPYYINNFDPKNNNLKGVLGEIERYDPDILCLQEFFTSERNNERTLAQIRQMGYRYYAFARQRHFRASTIEEGNIIFSKFPIIRKYGYENARQVSNAWDEPVFADVVVNGDTLRVGTFHMESYGFVQRDYEDLARIRNQNDENLQASRNIFGKMRYAFRRRGYQADLIAEEISRSPYPLVVCGDLNDVPASYSYLTVRGKMNDAFLEQGSGLGKTFTSGRSRMLTWLPTLRIDYIFLDKSFLARQFTLTERQLSDHRGLITDLELPKK